MPRGIYELSDTELTRFIQNYERRGETIGGVYPLAELKLEKLRRNRSPTSPRELYRFVVESASQSGDGRITYQDAWNFMFPGTPWKGNYSIKIVGAALGAVISYSVRHHLPIVSTLVVRSGSRRLSERAIQNIYNDCKAYGVDVGFAPADFVARETERALNTNLSALPDDEL